MSKLVPIPVVDEASYIAVEGSIKAESLFILEPTAWDPVSIQEHWLRLNQALLASTVPLLILLGCQDLPYKLAYKSSLWYFI